MKIKLIILMVGLGIGSLALGFAIAGAMVDFDSEYQQIRLDQHRAFLQ